MKTKHDRFEAFKKILKCIKSCETIDQTNSCERMIENYSSLYKPEFLEIVDFEANVLRDEIDEKNNIISQIDEKNS
jgi:hypothetical protein